MIISAVISWYEEDPEQLYRCVQSLGGLVDRVVAVDGAFRLWKEDGGRSSGESVEAIWSAAEEVGISCLVAQSSTPWAGEVAKLQSAFDLARGADWFFRCDSDYLIQGSSENKQTFREELQSHPDTHAWRVPIYTPAPNGIIPEWLDIHKDGTPNLWYRFLARGTYPVRCFFRALPEFKIELHHWWLSGLLNGERISLCGWDDSGGDLEGAFRYPLPKVSDSTAIQIEHRCFYRSEERMRAQREYLYRYTSFTKEHGYEE